MTAVLEPKSTVAFCLNGCHRLASVDFGQEECCLPVTLDPLTQAMPSLPPPIRGAATVTPTVVVVVAVVIVVVGAV